MKLVGKEKRAKHITATPSDSNPIFILGMNGSGTTVMLNCLNAHQALFGFPRETLVIPYYISTLEDYGDLDQLDNFKALWRKFREESHFCRVNGGEPPPLPDNWRELPRSLATVIDETFSYFARSQGKHRWCEKTPMHAQHIAALHQLFPKAYFIHMIRDGRSCAASFHRRWGYIPERTIYRWRNVIKTARQQAAECGARYMEVFYEELTSNPEVQMRRVCDFVGVEFDDAVLSPSRKPAHMGSTADTIVQSVPRWRTHFNERKVYALEQIAGSTLADLGYETGQGATDTDPSGISLRFWVVRDNVRSMARVIWEQITTPKEKQWDDLGGKLKRAIMQRLSSRF